MSGRKSRIQEGFRSMHTSDSARGGYRFVSNPAYSEYEVWFVDQAEVVDPATGPVRHARIGFPTMRVFESGDKERIPWTAETLMTYMQRFLRKVRLLEKFYRRKDQQGDWIMEIRERDAAAEPGDLSAPQASLQGVPYDGPGRKRPPTASAIAAQQASGDQQCLDYERSQ